MYCLIFLFSYIFIQHLEGVTHGQLLNETLSLNGSSNTDITKQQQLNTTMINISSKSLSDDTFLDDDFPLDIDSLDYADQVKASTTNANDGEFYGVQLFLDGDAGTADTNALRQCWKWCKTKLKYFSSLVDAIQPKELRKKRYRNYQTNYFLFKDLDRNIINTIGFNIPDSKALPIIQSGNLCICYFSRDNPSANRNWFISNQETINDIEIWSKSEYRFEKDGSLSVSSGFQNDTSNNDDSENATRNKHEKMKHKRLKIHWIGCLISAISLGVAFLISLFVDDINKQTKLLFQCHIVFLFCGFCGLFLKSRIYSPTQPIPCFVFSILDIFFFLSAYFWTNTQALELIVLLKCKFPILADQKAFKRFIFYCCYCCGIPFIIVVLASTAELYGSFKLSPGFRIDCWFYNNKQLTGFLYFYGWIALILTINFVLTIVILNKFYQKSKEENVYNKHASYHILRIFIQLMVIMGFSWSLKVIAWGLGDVSQAVYLDAFSEYQGFFVFLVYAFKPSILKRAHQKLFPQKRKYSCSAENPRKNLAFFQKKI